MEPPSITFGDSALEATIDAQEGSGVLNRFLEHGTPAQRRISDYSKIIPSGSASDTDSDSDDILMLQRRANLNKEGNEESDTGESDDDKQDVASLVLTSPQQKSGAAPSSSSAAATAVKKSDGVEKAKRAPRPVGELAKQLKFLGKQFHAIEADDVKHVVEKEKAKRDVYTFEWEANEQKPEWKQALMLSAMRPADGLKYLAGLGLVKNTPEARAKWLSHYRKMVLDNPIVIEWLCQENNVRMLECMVEQENAMAGLDIDVAFRRFVIRMDYLPDNDALVRLLNVFGGEYIARNPHRKEIVSVASAAHICNSLLALNNMYHTKSKLRRLRVNDWIAQSAGRNAGNDYPQGMLEEIFANVVSLPLAFEGKNMLYF
jgi:hypothetical protein